MLILMAACTGSQSAAPTEMSELTSYLFREFENPDALEDAVLNMDALLDDVNLVADPEQRSYALTNLTEDDLADVPHPDRDLADTASLGLAAVSAFPVEDHTAYMVLDDLTVISNTAEVYDRSFDVVDAGCFVDRSCRVMHTRNHIYRDSFVFQMEYDFRKDYRWVELVDRGEWAIVSRGWIAESAHGDSGNNHIWQNYEIDFWIPDGDSTRRYYGVWTEADYAGVTEDLARTLSLSAAVDALETLDEYLAEQR